MYYASLISQSVGTVAREQKGSIQVHNTRALCNQHRRRHRERSGDHTADHDIEPERFSVPRHCERGAESGGAGAGDEDIRRF